MPTSSAGIDAVGQVAITVLDLDRARAFYRDVLGLNHLFDAPPGMSFFQCGTVRLLLGLREQGTETLSTSVLYYRVPDIQRAHAGLAALKVAVREPPRLVAAMPEHDLWLAFYLDSEGNAFALMEEKRKAQP